MKRASQPVQPQLRGLSRMLTHSVCLEFSEAKNDRRWPIPNLHFFWQGLKNNYFL